MGDYDSFEEYLEDKGLTLEEWRAMKASSEKYEEQRKANKRPPRLIYEQGIEFVERESYDGGAYNRLVDRALDLAEEEQLINLDYEAESIKREMMEDEGFTYLEVKRIFKFSKASMSVVKREMILAYPHLARFMRLRKCKISQFYKGTPIEELEKSAAMNVEDGGDFAA